MKLITNTNEIKYGDIIFATLKTTPTDRSVLIKTNKHTDIKYNPEDRCYDIHILLDDVESFSEECNIAKCIMVDNNLHFVDLKTGDTFYWCKHIDIQDGEYTIWKLDIKI